MSRRRVQRRTVLAYIQSSRFQLERAMLAAVKCGEITADELRALRLAWRQVDDLAGYISRKKRKAK